MSDTPLREQFEEGLWVGDWYVEPMRNCVWHQDEEVQLEPKVMKVLLCMARRPGKTVTKRQFKEEVWTETVVTDDVLSRCISELRKTFDDAPDDPSYIETIRKTGYRLIAPVRRSDATESPLSDEASSFATASGASVDALIRRLQTIAEEARPLFSSVVDQWEKAADLFPSRRQRLLVGSLAGAVLVIGLVLWASSGQSESDTDPVSAKPFTSFGGEEFDPALSSLGHQLAFAWRQPDSLDQNIYLVQRGAEQPLQLSPDSTIDRSPTWSPDGRFVAYVQQNEDDHRISIVPSIGGRPNEAVHLPHRSIQSVAWMPDTTRRAVVVSAERRPHQASSLFLHFLDSDSSASLTTPPLWSIGDVDPTPSPDGSQIAFVRTTLRGVENIYVVPTSGGSPTQITTDDTRIDGLTWSADGSHLFYAAQRSGVSGLWQVGFEGEDPTLIRSASEGTHFSDPTFSAQSDRLAYTQKSSQLDLWALSRPNQYEEFTAEPLVSSTQEDMRPTISPKGKRIAFVSERSGSQEVWVAEADGSAPNRLTSLDGPAVRSVTWSPRGDRLCIVTRQKGQSDLYLIPASGGSLSRLTTGPSEDVVPRWSSDGQWIYFASNRTGHWEVWRTPASTDSQRVQQVTTGGAVAAQTSATNSRLYFVRPDTTGIWAVPLDTTALPLPTTPSSQTSGGELIADRSGSSPPPPDTSISPEQIVESFFPDERRDWWVSENGIHFVHRQSNSAVLAYFDFSTDRILPLYEFPDWRPVQSLAVGPRGEWFVYTHVVRRESDVMLVENFR